MQAGACWLHVAHPTRTCLLLLPLPQEEDLRKLQEAGTAAVFMPTSLYHTASSSSSGGSCDANASMVVGVSEGRDPGAHETWVALEHLSQVGGS